ncbi:hypothetical protein KBZ21_11545 [Streptomyces sp. A73]|nr:hypothetical protein [Streptomyces sp. A73]
MAANAAEGTETGWLPPGQGVGSTKSRCDNEIASLLTFLIADIEQPGTAGAPRQRTTKGEGLK